MVADTIIGKKPIYDSISVEMSLIYNENSKGTKTLPCETRDETGAQSVHRNLVLSEAQEKSLSIIHFNVFQPFS